MTTGAFILDCSDCCLVDVVLVNEAGGGNGGTVGSVIVCDGSPLLLAALLLRDLFLLREDDLGGGVGSGLSLAIFLVFLPTLSPSGADSILEDDSEF